MTSRRAVWARYWTVVVCVAAVLGAATGTMALITRTTGPAGAIVGAGITATGFIALGIYGVPGMRRTINRHHP